MRNLIKVFCVALVALIVFSMTACGNPNTVTYNGTTSNGDLYSLKIIKNENNSDRAVSGDPMEGDNFEFSWTAGDKSVKTSKGTIKEVNGDEFTMLPSNAATEDAVFTTTVTDGGLSAMSGEFTWTDGTTNSGSGKLTPVAPPDPPVTLPSVGGSGTLNGTWVVANSDFDVNLAEKMVMNNGSFTSIADNIEVSKGTYSTSGNNLTYTITQINGALYQGALGISTTQWYTQQQFKTAMIEYMVGMGLDQSMAESMYDGQMMVVFAPTTHAYTLSGNTLTTTSENGKTTVWTKR